MLNIEQINLTARYFNDEYKVRPQSAVERRSNSGKLCDRTKLLEKNLGYYFGLPDGARTSCWGDGCECGYYINELSIFRQLFTEKN